VPRRPPLLEPNVVLGKERVGVLERKDSKEVFAEFAVEIVQEVKVSDDNVVVQMPIIGTHAYYSYILILTVYKCRRVYLVLEYARHKYTLDNLAYLLQVKILSIHTRFSFPLIEG
jgi:hypothetical protein